MHIVAIDASRRRGVVSASVESAARAAESAGADVERIRLADLEIRTCTGCGICRCDGVCKIGDDLPAVAQAVDEADAIILGTPGLSGPDAAPTQALIDRLSGYFTSPRSTQRLPVPEKVRRAVIITTCKAPEPVAAFFGHAGVPIRVLRGALGSSGFKTIGSLSVGADWLGRVKYGRRDRDQAVSLGRVLAGKI